MKYISSLHKLSRKDVNSAIDYISSLDTLSRKDAGLDDISLRILEQFAWENYLSAYQIWSNLQSPRFHMAYKNVNKRTNTLLSSGLIQETKIVSRNKRRAKYFRLTEYGIYQLFLKQMNSLLMTQPRFRTDRAVVDASLTFLRNYGNSILFKIFLYPYFKKETLIAIGSSILWDLYEYLSTCCHSIERLINDIQLGRPLLRRALFSWNRIPGEGDEMLLSHLKQIFNLESVDPYDIKKEATSITVNTSSGRILIKLDKSTNKVSVMSTAGGPFKELQYDIRQHGKDTMVMDPVHSEEPIEKLLYFAKKQIEGLIYEFVYDLASSGPEISKEFSYYCDILSQDDGFKKVVQEIYENRHKGFEKGYNRIMNYRQTPMP